MNTIDERGTTISEAGSEYLKKFARDMPLGVCRELLAFQAVRADQMIRKAEENRTASPKLLADMADLGEAIRHCLDTTDAAIKEVGAETPLGTMPDYPEEELLKLVLTLMNWGGDR